MRPPQGAEWLIILALVLILFGAKRLPDAARGLGRSMRILKAETRGLRDDDPDAPATSTAADAPALPASPTAPATAPTGGASEPVVNVADPVVNVADQAESRPATP